MASTESFIKFVCGRCQSKKRSSLSTSSIEHSKGTHLLNDNIKLLIDKLSLIKPGASTENPTTVIPDNGTQYAADESNDTTKTSIENIYKLVLKASDKLNQIHTSEMEKNNMGAISALIDNKFKELSNTLHALTPVATDIFDNSRFDSWPMSPNVTKNSLCTPNRPSLLIKQSVDNDILEILKNSEHGQHWTR